MIEYPISIPEFMWHEKNWKGYFTGYLKKNWPDMKPIRIEPKLRAVICVRRGVDDTDKP